MQLVPPVSEVKHVDMATRGVELTFSASILSTLLAPPAASTLIPLRGSSFNSSAKRKLLAGIMRARQLTSDLLVLLDIVVLAQIPRSEIRWVLPLSSLLEPLPRSRIRKRVWRKERQLTWIVTISSLVNGSSVTKSLQVFGLIANNCKLAISKTFPVFFKKTIWI